MDTCEAAGKGVVFGNGIGNPFPREEGAVGKVEEEVEVSYCAGENWNMAVVHDHGLVPKMKKYDSIWVDPIVTPRNAHRVLVWAVRCAVTAVVAAPSV